MAPNSTHGLAKSANMNEMAFGRSRMRLVSDTPGPEALMRRVARGDRGAYAALYDLVIDRVFGIARRVIRDPQLAEEVAQEVMVEVWRKAAEFDETRGSVLSWVSVVAHRRAVDRVRSEQSRRDRERRSFTHDTPSGDLDDEIINIEEHRGVSTAMAALTVGQREAVRLAFYDGRTHNEVAEILDIPLGTAKTRIRDGLIKLRDAVSTEGGQPR